MIESFFQQLCDQAHHATWFLFILLLLSGLCLPISEDLILLSGGVLASHCLHNHWFELYLWLFAGCYLSAWEAYAIGRFLGPRLHQWPFFSRLLTHERLQKIKGYFRRFGFFTFIIGRFCPGGIRNAIFMSSGLIHMNFFLFILRDGIACLISTHAFFYLGYFFGRNLHRVQRVFHLYEEGALILLSIIAISVISLIWYKSRTTLKSK